jgi:urate oxidase
MTYELSADRYGKARIRLVTVKRDETRHDLRDLTVTVALEGDFEAAHVAGDNANVIATDTMKNTVYALAKDRLTGPPDAFAAEVARHFAGYPQVRRAIVDVQAHAWERITTPAGPAPDAFVRSGAGTRTARVTATPDGLAFEAGIEDLVVMKTAKSAFVGFERDGYTTLAEADDRLMATKVTATWGYDAAATGAASGGGPGFDFDGGHARAVERLLATFADHQSASVQASIWIIAGAMLDADPAIDWVRMVLPNLHHWTVDLSPFGLDNPGEVFVATTEPHGLIDATVRRRS